MQDQQVTSRRRDVVRAVADLSEQHSLPMPLHILLSGESVQLRCDDNDRDAVERWTEALGTGAIETSEPMDDAGSLFCSVSSEAWSFDGPTWMDARSVRVWSACDVPEAGEQA
jgi:hypothetical protein